jgi:two-component system sensor kinase
MSRDALTSNNTNQNTAKPTVLVVDDNPLIVEVLQALLRSQDYDVLVSVDGQQAWEAVRSRPVDVVICDVVMPNMGGYEFFELLRNDPEQAHIPFVFLTALDEQKQVDRGKQAGADDYLCKPFLPQQLLSVVKGKLSRSRALRELNETRLKEYRSKVIHTLSHEFRTPLVAVNSGVELLLEYGDSLDREKARNLLDAVRRGGARLEKLVTDFMVLQQIEAGIPTRLFESGACEYAVSDLMKKFMRLRQDSFQEHHANVRFNDQAVGARVLAVENHFTDCVDRLLDNALKFSDPGSVIEINLWASEQEIMLSVSDRGIGLDLTMLKEAIDLFGQLNRKKIEQQGSGLGLPIATHYARVNRGRIDFQARQGGGTVATLVLPRLSAN